MTVLEALAILEAGVLECTKRSVDTPEVREALDFLEPHIQPGMVIPQFHHHIGGERETAIRGKVNSRCYDLRLKASEARCAN